jgi:hypothetical protein
MVGKPLTPDNEAASADMTEVKATSSSKPTEPKVQIHYLKSQLFRVIHGEGVLGSISPHGKIFFVLFNERTAIPRNMTHLVNSDGTLGETLEVDSRGGIVREMEVGVLMDLDDAVRVRDWLSARITDLQEASKSKASNVRKPRKGK